MNTIPRDLLAHILIYVGKEKPGAAFTLVETSKTWKSVVEGTPDAPDAWVLPPLEYDTLEQYNKAEKWLSDHNNIPIHAHTEYAFSGEPNEDVITYLSKISPILLCIDTPVTSEVIPLLTSLVNTDDRTKSLRQLVLSWISLGDEPPNANTTWIPTHESSPPPPFLPFLSSLHLTNPPVAILEALAKTPALPYIYEFYIDVRSVSGSTVLQSIRTLLSRFATKLTSLRLAFNVKSSDTEIYDTVHLPDLEELEINAQNISVSSGGVIPFNLETPKLQTFINRNLTSSDAHVDLSTVKTLVQFPSNLIPLQLADSLQTLIVFKSVESNLKSDLDHYKDILKANPTSCQALVTIDHYNVDTVSPHSLVWARHLGNQTQNIIVNENVRYPYSNAKYLKRRPWACPDSRR